MKLQMVTSINSLHKIQKILKKRKSILMDIEKGRDFKVHDLLRASGMNFWKRTMTSLGSFLRRCKYTNLRFEKRYKYFLVYFYFYSHVDNTMICSLNNGHELENISQRITILYLIL